MSPGSDGWPIQGSPPPSPACPSRWWSLVWGVNGATGHSLPRGLTVSPVSRFSFRQPPRQPTALCSAPGAVDVPALPMPRAAGAHGRAEAAAGPPQAHSSEAQRRGTGKPPDPPGEARSPRSRREKTTPTGVGQERPDSGPLSRRCGGLLAEVRLGGSSGPVVRREGACWGLPECRGGYPGGGINPARVSRCGGGGSGPPGRVRARPPPMRGVRQHGHGSVRGEGGERKKRPAAASGEGGTARRRTWGPTAARGSSSVGIGVSASVSLSCRCRLLGLPGGRRVSGRLGAAGVVGLLRGVVQATTARAAETGPSRKGVLTRDRETARASDRSGHARQNRRESHCTTPLSSPTTPGVRKSARRAGGAVVWRASRPRGRGGVLRGLGEGCVRGEKVAPRGQRERG